MKFILFCVSLNMDGILAISWNFLSSYLLLCPSCNSYLQTPRLFSSFPQTKFKGMKLDIASQAIASLGSERTVAKRPVWDVAIDSIATWRCQTVSFGCTISSSTASAHRTNLKAPGQISPAHHQLLLPFWLHLHLHIRGCRKPICLQVLDL